MPTVIAGGEPTRIADRMHIVLHSDLVLKSNKQAYERSISVFHMIEHIEPLNNAS